MSLICFKPQRHFRWNLAEVYLGLNLLIFSLMHQVSKEYNAEAKPRIAALGRGMRIFKTVLKTEGTIWKKQTEVQGKEVKYYVLKEDEWENWVKLTKQQYCKSGSGCFSLAQICAALAEMKENIIGCLRKLYTSLMCIFKKHSCKNKDTLKRILKIATSVIRKFRMSWNN